MMLDKKTFVQNPMFLDIGRRSRLLLCLPPKDYIRLVKFLVVK